MHRKRIHIITGHYGSGKSEISVNMAMEFSQKGHNTILADLDIVNPYFRSNEARNLLESRGITVITTKYANTNVDIPALTGELSRYLKDKDKTLILDVGGDDAGAKVVGRYRSELPSDETCMYFVVNCFRPETRTLESVYKIMEEIRTASGMKVDYLINNSHLMEKTKKQDIVKGRDFISDVSNELKIPIAFHAMIKNDIICGVGFQEPVFYINKYMGYFLK